MNFSKTSQIVQGVHGSDVQSVVNQFFSLAFFADHFMLQGIWNGRDTACKVKQEHKYKDQIEMSVDRKVSIELCPKTNNHWYWQYLSDWILSHLKKADSLFKKIFFWSFWLRDASIWFVCFLKKIPFIFSQVRYCQLCVHLYLICFGFFWIFFSDFPSAVELIVQLKSKRPYLPPKCQPAQPSCSNQNFVCVTTSAVRIKVPSGKTLL